MGTMSLNWLLHQNMVKSVIMGASSSDQVKQNIKLVTLQKVSTLSGCKAKIEYLLTLQVSRYRYFILLYFAKQMCTPHTIIRSPEYGKKLSSLVQNKKKHLFCILVSSFPVLQWQMKVTAYL